MYDDILPGAADRIIKMAENQATHRQAMENKVVAAESMNSRLGVIFAFVLCLVCICGGVYCVIQDHDISGTVISGTGLASLIGVFIYGTRMRRAERENIRKDPEAEKK